MKKSELTRSFSLALTILFILPSFALTLKIKDGRNLRNETLNGFIPDKTLQAGTVVTIPDEFVDKHFKGDKKNEIAVLNWLANSKSLPLKSFKSFNSQRMKRDFFVPVIVNQTQDEGWVSLRSLAKKQGLELITTDEAPFLEKQTVENLAPKSSDQQQISGLEQDNYVCKKEQTTPLELELLERLNSQTQNILEHVMKKISDEADLDYANRLNTDAIIQNFNRTCSPISFNAFYHELKQQALSNSIPVDMLLGLMTQESSGRCNLSHQEFNGTHSVGVFQLNTNTVPEIQRCGDKPSSITNTNCLENPYTNLKAAIKILKEKYKLVNNTLPSHNVAHFSSLDANHRDLWRKALSAYNGGQGYVIQAYNDIDAFNKQFNTDLDPHNWNIRKVFMLRHYIESNSGQLLKSNAQYRYNRAPARTLSNLTYVEAILSGERDTQEQNQTIKWSRFIENPQF